jgi:hypothetical protein
LLQEGSEGYLFLLAVASPLQAFFLRLERQSVPIPTIDDWTQGEAVIAVEQGLWRHRYVLPEEPEILGAEGLVMDEEEHGELFVIPECMWLHPKTLVSSARLELWEEYLRQHAAPAAPRAAAAPAKAPALPKLPAATLEEHPWLREVLGSAALPRAKAAPGVAPPQPPAATAAPEPAPAVPPAELPEDVVESALAALREKRAAYADAAEPSTDFVVGFRGGKWTMAVKGTANDCVVGKAVTPEAMQWGRVTGYGQVASFAYTAYGEQDGTVLAAEWVHRAAFYFTLAQASGDLLGFSYTAAHVAAYAPTPAFMALLAELPEQGAKRTRALQLRDKTPPLRG